MASRIKPFSLTISRLSRRRIPHVRLYQPSPLTTTAGPASHIVNSPQHSTATPVSRPSRSFPSSPSRRPFSTSTTVLVPTAAGTPSDAAPAAETQTDGVAPPDYLSEAELAIFTKLKDQLQPVRLEVQDISGGCGSMYGLDIVSPRFKGLTVIKQHKLVNSVLAEEIKGWHGVQLKTKAP